MTARRSTGPARQTCSIDHPTLELKKPTSL
jgi:hypothetical protein